MSREERAFVLWTFAAGLVIGFLFASIPSSRAVNESRPMSRKARNDLTETSPRLSRHDHPVGTRVLYKTRPHSVDVYEGTVLEWAPSGKRVRIRGEHATSWREPPFLVEVLPAMESSR